PNIQSTKTSQRAFQTHTSKPSSVNNELCLEGQFCDAIIKVEDVEFPVHRIILCNCTPYFRQTVFNIPGLSSEMMALIINLHTPWNFSWQLINSINCAQRTALALAVPKVCLSPELRTKTYHYIISNFEQVVLEEEFLHLTVGELADILDREDLNVWETTLYEALTKWISHVPVQRKQHLTALLSKVYKLSLLHLSDYLKDNVLSSELVEANSECLSMISNEADPSCLPCITLLLVPPASFHPAGLRLPANRWVNVTNNLECPRAYHGAAFLNGYVYSVGGFDGVEHFNSVRRFDLTTHAWNEVAPMHSRRCYVSVTVLNGFIYALGGHDGHVRLSSAERYQPEINQWSLIAPMHEQRSHASCTTLNNRIYICGGLNGNECLQTAEYYNPESNQWTMISPMNSRRSGIGVIVIDDRLFVVGYYTALTNEWYEACDMDIFRTDLSCCVMSGLSNLTEYTFPRDFLPLEDVLKLAMESAEST
uniref:Kelch like family member 10 n=1 Tax=Maylandia zebra TaxID=106582 RepID=A0A3P9DK40_9CICH